MTVVFTACSLHCEHVCIYHCLLALQLSTEKTGSSLFTLPLHHVTCRLLPDVNCHHADATQVHLCIICERQETITCNIYLLIVYCTLRNSSLFDKTSTNGWASRRWRYIQFPESLYTVNGFIWFPNKSCFGGWAGHDDVQCEACVNSALPRRHHNR